MTMTFTIKIRGTPTRLIASEYECPFHGRFELDVERTADGDAPDAIDCPLCGETAEWRISSPLARAQKVTAVTRGKWQKPERETYTDTRNLGEGQPLNEWQDDRAKVWERWRQRDVMRFAKEHHERPIGGD
jgi:hypothetical protein